MEKKRAGYRVDQVWIQGNETIRVTELKNSKNLHHFVFGNCNQAETLLENHENHQT